MVWCSECMCRRVLAETGKPRAHRQFPSVSSECQFEKGRWVSNGPCAAVSQALKSCVYFGHTHLSLSPAACPALPGEPWCGYPVLSCVNPVSSSLVTATVAKSSAALHTRMGVCVSVGVMCRTAGNVFKHQGKWPDRSGFWFGGFCLRGVDSWEGHSL